MRRFHAVAQVAETLVGLLVEHAGRETAADVLESDVFFVLEQTMQILAGESTQGRSGFRGYRP